MSECFSGDRAFKSSSEIVWCIPPEWLLEIRKRAHDTWTHFSGSAVNSQTSTSEPPLPPRQNPMQHFFSELGPGLITDCADDDPSGISTYSVAGAGFGYGLLWTALASFPMMTAAQIMCGRLGMVTGRGRPELCACTTRDGFFGALVGC